MRTKIVPIALAGLLALGLGGCTPSIGSIGTTQGMTDGDNDTENTASAFDMNDVMFAQMMIPHHEQAVELATLAESNTTDVTILNLAGRIKEAQQPEIDLMQSWLDDAGAGMDMGHNMTMPGIVSDADMATIRAAKDGDFDRLFLTHMIAHHQGAIEMAKDVLTTSENPDVIALANSIITSQTAEIEEMQAMLDG